MIERTLFQPDHQAFADSFRRFIEKEVTPYHADWEDQGYVAREVWSQAGANGFLCMSLPEEYGGAGADKLYSVAQMEELARAGTTGIGFGLHSEIVAPYILHYGTEAQKQKYLPQMASGAMVGAIAMSEPAAGSDLQGIKTTAIKSADGSHYVLNGSKTFITNGWHADLVIVVAKTDPSAGAKGTSLLLVERGMAGIDAGVERHPGARAHADAGADRNGGQGARLPAVGGLHFGGFRGEGGERADRIARPLQGERFDGLGQSEQKDHHRRFRPLADDDCADDRQGHQEVDVERPVLEGDPAFLQGGQPGAEYGQRREGHDPLGSLLPGGPGHHLGADRGGAADGQQYLHPSTQGGWQCRRRSARFQQAGRHIQAVQCRGNRLRIVEPVVNRQFPCQ